MTTEADIFFESLETWKTELQTLRQIITSCGLEEGFKWGTPVYCVNNNKVIGIRGFKEHFALWFYKGVFLQDIHHLLVSAGDKTKYLRQIRLASMRELQALEKILPGYIREATEVEKAGVAGKIEKPAPVILPPGLDVQIRQDTRLAAAFAGLTPSRQKEYAEYITEAKQQLTRDKRMEKIIPMILQGIGLNDKYRKC